MASSAVAAARHVSSSHMDNMKIRRRTGASDKERTVALEANLKKWARGPVEKKETQVEDVPMPDGKVTTPGGDGSTIAEREVVASCSRQKCLKQVRKNSLRELKRQ